MRTRIIRGVVLALSGVLILALLNIDFLVRRNQDYLIGHAEQALGRKMSIDKIEVSLWPFGARLENFAMADDPAFSSDDFLRAKDLQIELRFLPLIVGRLRLKRMILEAPLVTIVRNAAGQYNFASSGRNAKRDRASAEGGNQALAEKPDSLLFLVSSLSISDGTLRYRDLRNRGGLTATQINLKIDGFAWDEPFDIQLEAAVMAAKPNLKLKSRVGPVLGNHDYRDVPLDGGLEADAVDLGKVNSALPQLKKALPKPLQFDGVYTIKDLKFKGTLNHLSLKGAVTGTDASFRFE
jgi:uncharacterized protein involved in outer membrane biogenesis